MKVKHLGINLTKHAQDMSDENYKMLMKEINYSLSNLKRHVFMDWKTQHSKDVNSP